MKTVDQRYCIVCQDPILRNMTPRIETPAHYKLRQTCGSPSCMHANKSRVAQERMSAWTPAQKAAWSEGRRGAHLRETPPAPNPIGCRHHWRIESQLEAVGDYNAECRHCGARRTYPRNPDLSLKQELQQDGRFSLTRATA